MVSRLIGKIDEETKTNMKDFAKGRSPLHLWRTHYSTLREYLGYICNRIKGVPKSAFEEETAKASPKEPSANSEEK